jgi:ribosomal protein S8E
VPQEENIENVTELNPMDNQAIKIPQAATKQEVPSPVSQDTATSILLSESTARKEETVMPEEPVIRLTRQQLYDEIWKISVAGLAKKYDIPYSQLMKQIKQADIPVPPSGYWTQLSFGKPVTKPELTEPVNEVISIYKTVPRSQTKKQKVELQSIEVKNETLSSENQAISEVSINNMTVKATVADAKETKTSNVSEEHVDLPAQVVDEPETYTQYGQTYNVYDRETLYKEVWEKPVTEVAKRYKVSDVAIHKVCKALDIPTPPAGYWAKLRAGKPVSVIPLPPSDKPSRKTGIQTGSAYQATGEKESLAFLNEEDRSVIFAVASQILLPDEGARMHPKIIAHRKVVAEWKKHKNSDNRVWNRRNAESVPFLADSISDESLPRACRIIDALIKAMEPLGCSLTDTLSFVVNGENVPLAFSESKDEVKHIPTKEENLQLLKYEEERKRYSWASKPQIRKYDHVFNGRLTLTVNGQKSFRDCKSYVLEDRLGDIMIEIYEAAEEIRKAREAREEAERKRQEEERRREELRKRYNVEVDRTLALTNLAEDYDTACKIRRYIAVVEAQGEPDEETAKWIEWAKAKADWYDPTVAREDEFFGKREHEKDAEKKKLNYKGYWW